MLLIHATCSTIVRHGEHVGTRNTRGREAGLRVDRGPSLPRAPRPAGPSGAAGASRGRRRRARTRAGFAPDPAPGAPRRRRRGAPRPRARRCSRASPRRRPSRPPSLDADTFVVAAQPRDRPTGGGRRDRPRRRRRTRRREHRAWRRSGRRATTRRPTAPWASASSTTWPWPRAPLQAEHGVDKLLDPRLGRPPRQRHPARVRGRSVGALLLRAPVPVLSGDRAASARSGSAAARARR